MGYYAYGSGSITFSMLTQNGVEAVRKLLEDEYCDVDVSSGNSPVETCFSFYQDEKYHDDTVRDILRDIKNIGTLLDGCIEYHGEDESFWRFIFVPGFGWIEQIGRVEYPPVESDVAAMRLAGVKPI